MTIWTDDLSTLSPEDVIRLELKNREWGKGLRLGTTALVNSRLAKEITLEEYAAKRQSAKSEEAECRRRTTVLGEEMSKRT
jgi:hypothetical protein